MPIKRPDTTERVTCVGRTGTGKTVGGIWHLSNYPLEEFPFVIIDFKKEKHFDRIPNIQVIDFDWTPHKIHDGLYRLYCSPYDVVSTLREKSRLDKFLIHIWEQGYCGIFIDEAYVIGDSEALNLCYTQGRALHIPMITCSQRPVWCSRFAFSEASYIQCFDLNDARDIQTVESFMPLEWDAEPALKKHQSYYFDIAENEMVRLNPVPMPQQLLPVFDAKLRMHRQRI